MARRTAWLSIVWLLLALPVAGCAGPTGSGSPTGPAGSAVVPAGHPLIGSWTTEVTKADLEAAGLEDPGLQNENSGRFTWTFAPDGTWTSVQTSLDGSAIDNPVVRGTYTLDGATLVATTVFPADYQDDGLHYTWVIDGDEVRFDVLDPPDPVLPVVVETHPWKRTG